MPKKDFRAHESTIFYTPSIFSSNCLVSMLYVVHSSLELRICGISSLWHPAQDDIFEGMGGIKSDELTNLLNQCTVQVKQQQ